MTSRNTLNLTKPGVSLFNLSSFYFFLFILLIYLFLFSSLNCPAALAQSESLNLVPDTRFGLLKDNIKIKTGPGDNFKDLSVATRDGVKYRTLDRSNIVSFQKQSNEWVYVTAVKPAYHQKTHKGWIKKEFLKALPSKKQYADALKKRKKKKSL